MKNKKTMTHYFVVCWDGSYTETDSLNEAKTLARELKQKFDSDDSNDILYIAIIADEELPDGITPQDCIFSCDIQKLDDPSDWD